MSGLIFHARPLGQMRPCDAVSSPTTAYPAPPGSAATPLISSGPCAVTRDSGALAHAACEPASASAIAVTICVPLKGCL